MIYILTDDTHVLTTNAIIYLFAFYCVIHIGKINKVKKKKRRKKEKNYTYFTHMINDRTMNTHASTIKAIIMYRNMFLDAVITDVRLSTSVSRTQTSGSPLRRIWTVHSL